MIDFSILLTAYPYLLRGALVTIKIAACSSIIGFTLGSLLGILHRSKNALIRRIIDVYVTLFRGTPMLIQIPFFVYYILPASLPLTARAIIAIGLNSAAYISQIIKSGIGSIAKGQLEAAKVLGLSPLQTMRYIIFPQAVRSVLPALLNEFITLIKDSSLASIIGVAELVQEGNIIITRTYNAIPIYCAIASIYLILTTSLSLLVNHIERKWHHHAHN